MECPNQTGNQRLDLWVIGSLSNNMMDSTIPVIFCYSQRVIREVKVEPKGQGDAGVSTVEVIS